eukprot:scaffold11075_cov23-Tisochrysis_lutea.AAC.5
MCTACAWTRGLQVYLGYGLMHRLQHHACLHPHEAETSKWTPQGEGSHTVYKVQHAANSTLLACTADHEPARDLSSTKAHMPRACPPLIHHVKHTMQDNSLKGCTAEGCQGCPSEVFLPQIRTNIYAKYASMHWYRVAKGVLLAPHQRVRSLIDIDRYKLDFKVMIARLKRCDGCPAQVSPSHFVWCIPQRVERVPSGRIC